MPARILFAALALVLTFPLSATATPLGQAFTYQGELSQSGSPVNGTVHLRFSLWDSPGTGDPPTGGTQLGSAQTLSNVPVSAGIFSVVLNAGSPFGPQAFNGDARWLQVEVCADTSCTSSTVLGPRQALTGAPYALGPWQSSGTSLGYTGGNVGIGTTTPAHTLHMKGNAPAMILEDTATPANQTGYLSFQNGLAETGWIGYGTTGSPVMTLANARTGGDIALWSSGERLRVTSTGNVGVGTATPASKLEVRGDIRLGSLGEYFAPAGSENLRIVRGKISATGTIIYGSGFTAGRTATGVYVINFSPNYISGQPPIVTASAESNSAARFAMINTPSHISCTIRIVNGSGTAADADFYFIAIGPR